MNDILQSVVLLVLGVSVQSINFVIFGDSTCETNGCASQHWGYQHPPSPPYSNLTRFSSYKVWLDYFGEEMEEQGVELFDCSCSGTQASIDAASKVPGLLTQVMECTETQDLVKVAEDEGLVAIIMIGGNDLFYEITGSRAVDPQDFVQAFDTATRQLLQLGVQHVFIGNTLYQAQVAPFLSILNQTQPELANFAELKGLQLIAAQEEGLADMQNEGLRVEKLPLQQFYVDIQEAAVAQGLNAFDSCLNFESALESRLAQVLPDCAEMHQRMWIDTLHLADWGHKQLYQKITDFLVYKNIL